MKNLIYYVPLMILTVCLFSCEIDDTPPAPPTTTGGGAGPLEGPGSTTQTENISVTIPTDNKLCPTWTYGDRDFGGIANIHAKVTISIKNGNELWRKVEFDLQEPNPDYTTAEGVWQNKVYQAPSGWKINSIQGSTTAEVNYTDTDHSVEVVTSSSTSSPCYKMMIKGDTSGNDVGNCTNDDAYLSVYYNPINVQIKEI